MIADLLEPMTAHHHSDGTIFREKKEFYNLLVKKFTSRSNMHSDVSSCLLQKQLMN